MSNPLEKVKAAFPPPTPLPTVPAPICAHEFLAMHIPPRKMLLAPWLPEKGLAMIAAVRGIGKTHTALGVAYAVASGGEFLGWKAPAPRPVVYIDGEMPAIALQERLARIASKAVALPLKNTLGILAADQCEFGLPDLSLAEGQKALMPRLEPFDLIVLDNLSTLCRSGRENEAESWSQVQGFLLELRRAGKSVLLIHHAGKGGLQRGTSKREDVLDSVLLLKRPDDYDAQQGARFICSFDKARGFSGPDAAPFEAMLDPHTGEWMVQPVTQSRDTEIKAMKAQGMTIREIEKETGIPKSTVARRLKMMNGGDHERG